jgi:hypothetical protein
VAHEEASPFHSCAYTNPTLRRRAKLLAGVSQMGWMSQRFR